VAAEAGRLVGLGAQRSRVASAVRTSSTRGARPRPGSSGTARWPSSSTNGLRHVLREVARAGGGVAGQPHVGERCERDRPGPPDPGLEHAAAPDRHVEPGAEVVDADGLVQPADAARLDVHDPAGTARDRVTGPDRVGDGLVEAHRGPPPRGVSRVVAQPVRRERLLDLYEPELVEPIERGHVVGIVGVVAGVGVDLQGEVVAEPGPQRRHRRDVVPAGDLRLDPQVAVVEVAGDEVEQLGGPAVGDADRHAGGDPVTGGAEVARQRAPGGPELGVEDRLLEGRLRHAVALAPRERRPDPAASTPASPSEGTRWSASTAAAPSVYSAE
jgi:hypothetical protein